MKQLLCSLAVALAVVFVVGCDEAVVVGEAVVFVGGAPQAPPSPRRPLNEVEIFNQT